MHEYHPNDLNPFLATDSHLHPPGLDTHMQTNLDPGLDLNHLLAKLMPEQYGITDTHSADRGFAHPNHGAIQEQSADVAHGGSQHDILDRFVDSAHDLFTDKFGATDFTPSAAGEPAHLVRHVEHDGSTLGDFVNAGVSAAILDATGIAPLAPVGGYIAEKLTDAAWDAIMKSI